MSHNSNGVKRTIFTPEMLKLNTKSTSQYSQHVTVAINDQLNTSYKRKSKLNTWSDIFYLDFEAKLIKPITESIMTHHGAMFLPNLSSEQFYLLFLTSSFTCSSFYLLYFTEVRSTWDLIHVCWYLLLIWPYQGWIIKLGKTGPRVPEAPVSLRCNLFW